MRYVILRDDDTNALTPPDYLEKLYRPFLKRQMPVNLAVIPEVRTNVRMPNGEPEGFLVTKNGVKEERVPITDAPELVHYLNQNSSYKIAQHGCYHDYFEFDGKDREEMRNRIQHGTQRMIEAGLGSPETFIAPYDKISRTSMEELARRFRVISTGWFEWRRLPGTWLGKYALIKALQKPHWKVSDTVLLSHPGCLLSCHRPYDTMFDTVRRAVQSQRLTVLVTHWWEYFRNNKPDETFIAVLHNLAEYLASQKDLRVVSFGDVAAGKIPLN